MEPEINRIMMLILMNPQIKHDFIYCLNQYVLYGNKGRNLSMEYKIKKELAQYQLLEKTKQCLINESLFSILFNQTKKSLSKEYVFQKLKEAKTKLKTIKLSIDKILNDNLESYKSKLIIPNSSNIVDYCDKIIQFNDPFLQNVNKKTLIFQKRQIIAEIDQMLNNETEKQTNYKIQNDISFCISLLSEGLNFCSIERFLAKNNISILSESKFYYILNQLNQIIIDYSKQICEENFISIKNNMILSFDSSWAHKRRSFQCFGALIDAISGKIIDWNTIESKEKSPQSLEIDVLTSMLDKYYDPRVIGHIQDGDVNTINLIKKLDKEITIYLDPNHTKGKFNRILEKFNEKGDKCFNPIKQKLTNFFTLLLYNKILTISQKKFQWQNVLNHFIGIHKYCLHSYEDISLCPEYNYSENRSEDNDNQISDIQLEENEDNQNQYSDTQNENSQNQSLDTQFERNEANQNQNSDTQNEGSNEDIILDPKNCPNLIYYLQCFLEYTNNLFDLISPRLTTQSNESLNSIKSNFAGKNTNWRFSFTLRMAFAILQKNNPYLYYIDLLNYLTLPALTEESINIINKYHKISQKQKIKFSKPDNIKKRNIQRYNYRHKKFSENETDHITRIKELTQTEEEINLILKSFKPFNIQNTKINKTDGKTLKKNNLQNKNYESDDYYESDENSFPEEESESYTDNSDEEDDDIPDICELFPKPLDNINSGLNNLGNTCFISTALQMIFQLPFIEDVLENPHDNIDEIALSLSNLYYEVKYSPLSVIPFDFVSNYQSVNDIENTPDDAYECFINLMSILELNFDIDKSLYSYSLIRKIDFICGYSATNSIDDIFIEIHLYNNKFNDLQEYLTNFSQIIDTQQVKCPIDNSNEEAQITYSIHQIPKILFLHVNKYYYSCESQNTERIAFLLDVNDIIEYESKRYKFKCSILHFGSRFCGHYKFLLNHNEEYYIYNDAFVEKVLDFQYSLFNENYDLLMYIQI